MTQQTSTSIVQKGTTQVDQQFFVPPNIIDVKQEEIDDIREQTDYANDEDDVEEGGETTREGIPAPSWIKIIRQTVRAKKGGGVVVDVIIEVEDVDGVSEYEKRLSKA